MAATYTLSGNPKTLLGGEDFERIRAYVTCDQPILTDPDAPSGDPDAVRVIGEADLILAGANSTAFSVDLPGNDWTPSPHFYTLHIEGRSRATGANRVITSQPFQMTANITLADLPQAAPKAITVTDYESLIGARDEAIELRDETQQLRDDAAAITAPLTAPANEQVASYITADGATKATLSATIDGRAETSIEAFAVRSSADFVTRLRTPYLDRWLTACDFVRRGLRDAKVLIVGDSTAGGVGGGSAASFVQANSWPSFLVDLLDATLIPTAHGLAVPPSNSGAIASPYDSRWTLGAGWSWRTSGALDSYIGFGGKGTNIKTSGSNPLTFNDPRVQADTFDVYLLATNSASGAAYSIQATGGPAATGSCGGHPDKHLMKVTVTAATAAKNNVVTITRTGGSGDLYVVGVEPYLSTAKKVRVANAGISGSNSVGWTTFPSGGVSNTWNGEQFIRDYRPDLTIIDIGINDADPSGITPTSDFVANIQTLIAAAKLSGDVIVKTAIPTRTRTPDQTTLLNALKAAVDVPVIDVFAHYGTSALLDRFVFLADDLHMTQAGYRDEANYVHRLLQDAMKWSRSGDSPVPALPVTDHARRFVSADLSDAWSTSVLGWLDHGDSGAVLAPTKAGGTAATAPALVRESGRKLVKFDGNDGLGQVFTATGPTSVIALVRLDALPPTSSFGVMVGADTDTPVTLFVSDTGGVRGNAGTTLNDTGPALVPGAWHAVAFVSNGSSSLVGQDGNEASGAAGSNVRQRLALGRYANAANSSAGSNPLAMTLAELVVFNRAITAAEIQAIFDLWATEYDDLL